MREQQYGGIPFPIVHACKIASQVCEGLYHAHQRGDVHGKPLGIRSDIFSLGVVLYEWVTGFKLFTGDSDVQVLKSITEGKIYQPSCFKQDVPEAVEAILMKALEEDPANRYQSAWELQAELDRFLVDNEFTPSNHHLATFMKQLFNDEIEEERRRLLGRGVQPAALGGGRFDEVDVDAVTADAQSGPRHGPGRNGAAPSPRGTSPGRKGIGGDAPAANLDGAAAAVPVQFSADEHARLEQLASRQGTPVAELVRQITQGIIRYLA